MLCVPNVMGGKVCTLTASPSAPVSALHNSSPENSGRELVPYVFIVVFFFFLLTAICFLGPHFYCEYKKINDDEPLSLSLSA